MSAQILTAIAPEPPTLTSHPSSSRREAAWICTAGVDACRPRPTTVRCSITWFGAWITTQASALVSTSRAPARNVVRCHSCRKYSGPSMV